MKHTLIKLSIAATLGLGLSAGAVAATGVFTWTGTIPAKNIITTAEIINTASGTAHDRGTIKWIEDAATPNSYTIQDSTQFEFLVVGAGTTTPVTAFSYSLDALAFSTGGGLHKAVDTTTPEFNVTDEVGNVLSATPIASLDPTVSTKLVLGTPAPLNQTTGFVAGDSVIVQATILVSSITI